MRHGAAPQDTGLIYHVLPGPPLSARGRAEAAQAAAFLAGRPVAYLVASPFARQTQTGEYMSARLGVPRDFSPFLVESGPNEDTASIRVRVRRFLQDGLATSYPQVALVSHGFPIKQRVLERSGDPIDL